MQFSNIMERALKLVVIEMIGLAVMSVGIFGSPLPQQPVQKARDGPQSQAQLQQMVAPIALYPDELVAQILAASTNPSEIVAADRFVQQHAGMQGEQLAAEVDRLSWDPSVKALTAFPGVLSNMDQNLSWTTALGDAYNNQQQEVFDAVQTMRSRAQNAGNLQTTPQQTVTSAGSTIVIEPTNPDTCYLPMYDPWLVYGATLDVYPGYIYYPWYGPPYLTFAAGVGLGFFGRFGWGWNAWRPRWDRRTVFFNRAPYISRGRPIFRGNGGDFRGGGGFHGGGGSFHGGGGFHGGGFHGGGFHGGGFHGGGFGRHH